jgi:hypothetical protein
MAAPIAPGDRSEALASGGTPPRLGLLMLVELGLVPEPPVVLVLGDGRQEGQLPDSAPLAGSRGSLRRIGSRQGLPVCKSGMLSGDAHRASLFVVSVVGHSRAGCGSDVHPPRATARAMSGASRWQTGGFGIGADKPVCLETVRGGEKHGVVQRSRNRKPTAAVAERTVQFKDR